MKELKERLKQSILFENIEDSELEEIMKISSATTITLQKGEQLFYQEEEPKNLYILLSGSVQIEKVDSNGKRMIMNRFDTIGTLFGEVYIYFEKRPYDYSCVAIKDSKVYAISKNFFLHLGEKGELYGYKLTQNMLKILSEKALFLNQKVLLMSSFTLRQKIASYLLQRIKESHLRGNKEKLSINLLFKREEMADFIGTTRPSLSRELSLMQKEGILKLNKNSFSILDVEKLKNIL